MVEDDRQLGIRDWLSGLSAVTLAQPRLPFFRPVGPKLIVSTVESTVLGEVREVNAPRLYVLVDPGGRTLLRVEVAMGRLGAPRPVFRFADAEGAEVGTAESPRWIRHAGEIHTRTAAGAGLRITRVAPARREWLIADELKSSYGEDGARGARGRVTADNVGSMRVRQRYVVEFGDGLDTARRQVVLASVIGLYLIRGGPIGGGS